MSRYTEVLIYRKAADLCAQRGERGMLARIFFRLFVN
jgi:hypothetical protein